MADWFIATEGVKVVKDSASLWPQIITAVLSAGTAFGGVWYGQWRITQREEEAATAKLVSERLFYCHGAGFSAGEVCAALCSSSNSNCGARSGWQRRS
ncbi:hypothetical protein DIW91_23655 [Salmonella enterica subsp. enterica serovar Kentucky]|nr:hypothetical protein [Salmonella enterica subsp. enterica serovar Kentucky]